MRQSIYIRDKVEKEMIENNSEKYCKIVDSWAKSKIINAHKLCTENVQDLVEADLNVKSILKCVQNLREMISFVLAHNEVIVDENSANILSIDLSNKELLVDNQTRKDIQLRKQQFSNYKEEILEKVDDIILILKCCDTHEQAIDVLQRNKIINENYNILKG